jgi:alpha-tubulin suppressor-like RCC1 family protein
MPSRHSSCHAARLHRRASRRSRRFTWALAGTLIIAAAGCSQDSTSPLNPESTPDLSASALTATLQFRQVSAGFQHTCAVTTDDRAYCWGDNESGQLGNGSFINESRPAPVEGGLLFRVVSAGFGASCGITTTSQLYCWGNDHSHPADISGGRLFRQVDVGGANHSCAVGTDGKAYCWGGNTEGKLGDGTTTFRSSPTAVAGGRQWRQVAAGEFHSCGVTTGNVVFCWGSDQHGQLGDGSTRQNRLVPTRIASTRQFRQLDLGWEYSCAVTIDDRGFCWGDGSFGHIGDGGIIDRYTPRAVAGGLQIDRLNVGGNHSCAEVTGNQVYCWGVNEQGQFGNGTTKLTNVRPVLAAGGRRFVQVSAGGGHTCGVNGSAAAFCWGSNSDGELGTGNRTRSTTPVQVASP